MRPASRLRRTIIALILFVIGAFAISGCSGPAAATQNELPTGAAETLNSAMTTLFTWRPAFDQSEAAAFQRARPYFTGDALQLVNDLQDEPPAKWSSWEQQGAVITPTFTVQTVDGATDTYTSYTRAVRVVQHVRNAKGENLDDLVFDLPRVVLTFSDGTWRISKIDGLDKAGGGICPRNADDTCRTPARSLTPVVPTTTAANPAAVTTTTPAPTTTTTAPGLLPSIGITVPLLN